MKSRILVAIAAFVGLSASAQTTTVYALPVLSTATTNSWLPVWDQGQVGFKYRRFLIGDLIKYCLTNGVQAAGSYQPLNGALTALAANPALYQATNANLTALALDPALYQATNVNLTTLASNDGSSLTNMAGATNGYQFVTLEQLEESVSGGVVAYFTSAAASGFTMGGTTKATNYSSQTLPASAWTNTAVTSANGDYIAAFITTNTFASIASGLGTVDVYCFDDVAGSGSIAAEFYIVNSVTKAEEYEFTPSPAYQAVPTGGTPTKLTFAVPITDYTSTTNFHLAIKIKVSESSTPDPTIRIVGGGAYASHVQFALPSSVFVQKSGDTMTGELNVPDEAYGAGWNESTVVPTQNAVYDKIESLVLGGGTAVLVNGSSVSNPNFTNSNQVTFTVDGTTNVRPNIASGASLTNVVLVGSLTTSALTGAGTNLYNLLSTVTVDASGNVTAASFSATGVGATFGSIQVTNKITNDVLTASRIVFVASDESLTDDADMTFSTDTLTVTKLSAGANALNVDSAAVMVGTNGNVSNITLQNSDGTLRLVSGGNPIEIGGGLLQSTNGVAVGATNMVSALAGKEPELTDSASLRSTLSDETGTGVAVFGTAPTLTGVTINDTARWEQAALTEAAAPTNFVADFTVSPMQLISTHSTTNSVNFLHATNVAAGRWTTILVDPTTNTTCTLTIPSTWFRRGFTSGSITVTNNTLGVLSLYGYGADNTNVLATYSFATK